MRRDVNAMLQQTNIVNTEYFLCGNRVDHCPEHVIQCELKLG
jgi:hypothetical protein